MPTNVSATEARVHFGELLRRVVESREAVYVERGGRPQVVVLAVSDYESLLAGGEPGAWLTRAREVREHIKADLGDRVLPPAEDLIREMREERDGHLDSLC